MPIFQRSTAKAILACGLTLGFAIPATATATANVQAAETTSAVNDVRIALLQAKPRAYAIVEASGRSDQSRVRLAAIEAAMYAPDAAVDLVRAGLTDENPAVRFASLVTIGRLELKSLAPAALDLLQDENASVRAAALFAGKRCGQEVDLSPLGAMLASANGSTRANAAMLIGHLGDTQAVPMLREMANLPMPRALPAERTWVRLQFAEAMIRLDPNDDAVLGSIRASMFSNLNDVRVLAIQILGEVSDQSVLGGLSHIAKRDNPIQVKIAAAQSMLKMGDAQGLGLLLKATRYDAKTMRRDLTGFLRKAERGGDEARAITAILRDPAEQARMAAEVRAQAARALGDADSQAAADRLSQLLDDPSPIVQVASAAAVLRATR